MKLQNIYFATFIFSIFLSFTKAETFSDINFVISYKLNGTAAFASLEYVNPNEKYLYFSFDFNYHNSLVPKSKDKAYFSIDSDFELATQDKEKITYGFSEFNWSEIKSKDIEKIEWNKLNYRYKVKQNGDFNYYSEIERENDKMNTLLIRIPINGRNEGYITIENIADFSFLKGNIKN